MQDKYEKIPLQLREMEDPHKDVPPSSEEKRRFAENMYRIKMDDLTKIVSHIDSLCPDALEKVDGCDEIEINLDKIDAGTFHSVSQKMALLLPLVYPAKNVASGAGHGGGKKKRKKDAGSSSSAAAAPAAAASSSSSKEHSGAASSSSSKHKKQKV
jgi:Bromodomain extra-terminal - transcription regulation